MSAGVSATAAAVPPIFLSAPSTASANTRRKTCSLWGTTKVILCVAALLGGLGISAVEQHQTWRNECDRLQEGIHENFEEMRAQGKVGLKPRTLTEHDEPTRPLISCHSSLKRYDPKTHFKKNFNYGCDFRTRCYSPTLAGMSEFDSFEALCKERDDTIQNPPVIPRLVQMAKNWWNPSRTFPSGDYSY